MSRPLPDRAVGALLVLAAATLWGSLGLFGKHLFAHDLQPLEVASARAAIAFLTLAVGMAPWARRLVPARRDLPRYFLYGAVSIGLFYFLYLEAIQHATIAVAAALLYTAPGFVLLFSWALRWEPVRPRLLLPLTLTMGGAFMVTGGAAVLFTRSTTLSLAGVAAGLGSGITYALFTVLGKRVVQTRDLLQVLFWAYGFGALVLGLVSPPWKPFLDAPGATPLLVGMGIGPSLLATLLFLAGVRYLQASTASMLATLEPVVAAVLGITLLSEPLHTDTALGIGMVVGGALLLARRPARASATARPASRGQA